jgi:TFIIF-interacting CTD phosphatase-like protein
LMLRQGKLPTQLAAASCSRNFSKSRRSSKTIQQWEVKWEAKGELLVCTDVSVSDATSFAAPQRRTDTASSACETNKASSRMSWWVKLQVIKCESEAVD